MIVDRAYDAYEAVADAFDATPDCSAAVAAALREAGERRADLEAAFALQADPKRLEAARPVLESRVDHFDELSAALEAAFGRCGGTPGLDRLQEALDR